MATVTIHHQQAVPIPADLEGVLPPSKSVSTTPERTVCAVIVSYHPRSEALENIRVVMTQVQALVVVDNGSDADEVATLRASSEASGFRLIENQENRGIAEALNQGIAWARSRGFPWVILFDQDSTITSGFIDQMFATWESHPRRERVGSIHPRYRDRLTGVEQTKIMRAKSDGGPITSWTSGALMPTWIFDRVGYFASDFFIDYVDHEYCFRLRAAGYYVADSREAILLHSPGQPAKVSVLGFSFVPSNHSAVRRYYISRNRVVVYRKYFPMFPAWVLQHICFTVRETAKWVLGEHDRVRKLRNFLLGTWDGLVGKMGKRENL
jgi:rhamnosyltransferase